MAALWDSPHTGSNAAIFDGLAKTVSPHGEADADPLIDPPAGDRRKAALLDADHIGEIWGHVGWVFRCFVRGLNPIFLDCSADVRRDRLAMRPDGGPGLHLR